MTKIKELIEMYINGSLSKIQPKDETEVIKHLDDLANIWGNQVDVHDRQRTNEKVFQYVNELPNPMSFRKQFYIQHYTRAKHQVYTAKLGDR